MPTADRHKELWSRTWEVTERGRDLVKPVHPVSVTMHTYKHLSKLKQTKKVQPGQHLLSGISRLLHGLIFAVLGVPKETAGSAQYTMAAIW